MASVPSNGALGETQQPGRSLVDGCELTLVEVAFTKTRSDGVSLVGLAMNRFQCRTTSDNFLIDPYLVKRTPPSEEIEAFLVGAYCIEDELILRRKIRFPRGVAAGDLVAIPNTAGYFMAPPAPGPSSARARRSTERWRP
ncbi:hypothetical protein CJEDD_05870 [Corynebacterium jeddahense]|uniref:Orn/DAP/Arg decarboxylase 2 C-terminal domain-containing protein n=1 Tax=Corynebacterium jeddahense TaxID=1414719 RepID=A0ABY7UJG9_9CORY|nr:hypothetical protein CJEDD_05870 [Corynebacterium jeddahense]